MGPRDGKLKRTRGGLFSAVRYKPFNEANLRRTGFCFRRRWRAAVSPEQARSSRTRCCTNEPKRTGLAILDCDFGRRTSDLALVHQSRLGDIAASAGVLESNCLFGGNWDG